MPSAAALNTHTYYIQLVANRKLHVPPIPCPHLALIAIVALWVAMSAQEL